MAIARVRVEIMDASLLMPLYVGFEFHHSLHKVPLLDVSFLDEMARKPDILFCRLRDECKESIRV
jgi:hypothetical protein